MSNSNENSHRASIIKILETDLGPMISESRTSVYDVKEKHDIP